MKQSLSIILFSLLFSVNAQNLSVMTYNIRLDYSGDGKNQWADRKEQMVNQLRFYEPDIFGIQEGLPDQVSFLDQNLSAYHYTGVGRDDGKNKGEFSAIYFRFEAFTLLKNGTFWLSPTPDTPSVGWDAALPRICTFGLFEERASKKVFWVFNTHFDHVGKEARVNAMKLILDKIEEYNVDNLPVILMGDLNVEPDDQPILEMKKELQDARDIADVVFGPDATFNGFNFEQSPTRRIDYISVNDQFSLMKYAVLTDSFSQHYISDHFPVFCSLSFKD